MSPIVSVITPVYNAEPYLAACIQSVLAQEFSDWELILIEDHSRDKSYPMAQEWAEREDRIRLLQTAYNQGPAKARNLGIAEARGRFIAFLDSDDVWLPQKLALQIPFMLKKKAALSYHAYGMYDENLQILKSEFNVPSSVSYRDMLYFCVISMCAAVYDTKLTGGKVYMPLIEKRQDYGLFLRILRQGHQAQGLSQSLLKVRLHPHSVSANKWKAALYQWRVYRELEGLSLPASLWYFGHYAWHGLRKYWL